MDTWHFSDSTQEVWKWVYDPSSDRLEASPGTGLDGDRNFHADIINDQFGGYHALGEDHMTGVMDVTGEVQPFSWNGNQAWTLMEPKVVEKLKAYNPNAHAPTNPGDNSLNFKFADIEIQNGGHEVQNYLGMGKNLTTVPWQLGRNGKGMVLNNKLHLWSVGQLEPYEAHPDPHHDGIHDHVMGSVPSPRDDPERAMALNESYLTAPKFYIAPNGVIDSPRQRGENKLTKEQLAALHPDLKASGETPEFRFARIAKPYDGRPFTHWWDKHKPITPADAKVLADYAYGCDFNHEEADKFIDKHKDDIHGSVANFKERFFSRFRRLSKVSNQPIPLRLEQGDPGKTTGYDAGHPNFAVPWEPGKRGKGIVLPDGRVVSWALDTDFADGSPIHPLSYDGVSASAFRNAFWIDEQGGISHAWGQEPARILEGVAALHPDWKTSQGWSFR